jgi:hypothetical protein
MHLTFHKGSTFNVYSLHDIYLHQFIWNLSSHFDTWHFHNISHGTFTTFHMASTLKHFTSHLCSTFRFGRDQPIDYKYIMLTCRCSSESRGVFVCPSPLECYQYITFMTVGYTANSKYSDDFCVQY